MTKTITIVTGSVRPNSAGNKILPVVESILKQHDVNVQIADLRELNLPFFDAEQIPSSEDYKIEQDNVKQWQSLVQSSDGIIMLTPEYNYQMTAVQKNAIDWLYSDWKGKLVSIVSYSWGGGEKSADLLKKLLEKLEAKPLATTTKLYFTKQISPDGSIINEDEANKSLNATINELISAI